MQTWLDLANLIRKEVIVYYSQHCLINNKTEEAEGASKEYEDEQGREDKVYS